MLDKLVNGQLIKCIDNTFVEYMLEVGELYFFDSYAYGINPEPFRILIYTDKQPIVGFGNHHFGLPNYDEINAWYDNKEKLLQEERRNSIKLAINSMK